MAFNTLRVQLESRMRRKALGRFLQRWRENAFSYGSCHTEDTPGKERTQALAASLYIGVLYINFFGV